LRETRDSQPLSREEEVELAKKIKNGDESALEKLVRANLKFVIGIANEYQHMGLDMPELISEGNYGLMVAARRFDETRGFKFITYAVWWIRQAIQSALREDRNVHRPTNRLSNYSKINKRYGKLSNRIGREPTDDEIAEEIGISADDIRAASFSISPEISLDAPFKDMDDKNLYDVLSSENVDPIRRLEEEDLRDYVNEMLGKLGRRESAIIRKYFGFDGKEPMTLEQIGSEFRLSKERIRQIKARAYGEIRKRNKAETVKDEIIY